MLGHLGAILGLCLGPMLGHLGAILGLCWAILGHLGPSWGSSWAILGLCWGYVVARGAPWKLSSRFLSKSTKHRTLRGVSGSAAGAVLLVPSGTAITGRGRCRSTGPAGPIGAAPPCRRPTPELFPYNSVPTEGPVIYGVFCLRC